MEKLLEEEMCRARKLEEYTKYRDYNAQSLLTLLVKPNLFFFFILSTYFFENDNMKEYFFTFKFIFSIIEYVTCFT